MRFLRRNRNWRLTCLIFLLLWLLLSCLLQAVFFINTLYCLHWKTKQITDKLCTNYNNGLVVGQLCDSICSINSQFSIQSCYAPHLAKAVVFTAKLDQKIIVLKSIFDEIDLFDPLPFKMENETVQGFGKAISELAVVMKEIINHNLGSEKLGFMYLNHYDLLRSILVKDFGMTDETDLEFGVDLKNRKAVLNSLWWLIQQKEYLTFKSLENTGLFPNVIGSCGFVYAVDYFQPAVGFLQSDWQLRAKIALGIINWLEKAQNYYQQPIRVCDVKLNHFGIGNNDIQDVKFLDADDIYFQSTLNDVVSLTNQCTSNQDCSYFDCLMNCDLQRQVCDVSSVNTNLQVVCSKLFMGSSSIITSFFKPNFLHSIPSSIYEEGEILKQLFNDNIVRRNSTYLNFDRVKLLLKKLLST